MSPRPLPGNSTSPHGAAPVTIYLTRHGETMLNALGRVQGWSDAPLTSKGRDVAGHLGTGLAAAGVTFDAAHAADMMRHGETLALALEGLDFTGEVVRDARLREMAFGRFEGASNSEMWEAMAAEAAQANDGAPVEESTFDFKLGLEAMVRLNEGSGLVAETLAEVAERAFAALTEIAEHQAAQGGGNVLVVSSGITIMAAVGAMGADLEKATGGIGNAAVAELQYSDGSWTVATFNDLSYVEAGLAARGKAA